MVTCDGEISFCFPVYLGMIPAKWRICAGKPDT